MIVQDLPCTAERYLLCTAKKNVSLIEKKDKKK